MQGTPAEYFPASRQTG